MEKNPTIDFVKQLKMIRVRCQNEALAEVLTPKKSSNYYDSAPSTQPDCTLEALKTLSVWFAQKQSDDSAVWQDVYAVAMCLIAEAFTLNETTHRTNWQALFDQGMASLICIGSDSLGEERARKRAREVLWLLSGASRWAHMTDKTEELELAIATIWQNLPRDGLNKKAQAVLKRHGVDPSNENRAYQNMACEITELDEAGDALRAALEGELEAASCFF